MGHLSPSLLPDSCHFRRRGWLPTARLHGRHMFDVHGVNFFESPTLTFNDEEVYEKSSSQIAPREYVAVAEIDRTDDKRGEESEQEIPGPVACGCHCHALGPVA